MQRVNLVRQQYMTTHSVELAIQKLLLLLNWVRATPDRPFMSYKGPCAINLQQPLTD